MLAFAPRCVSARRCHSFAMFEELLALFGFALSASGSFDGSWLFG